MNMTSAEEFAPRAASQRPRPLSPASDAEVSGHPRIDADDTVEFLVARRLIQPALRRLLCTASGLPADSLRSLAEFADHLHSADDECGRDTPLSN